MTTGFLFTNLFSLFFFSWDTFLWNAHTRHTQMKSQFAYLIFFFRPLFFCKWCVRSVMYDLLYIFFGLRLPIFFWSYLCLNSQHPQASANTMFEIRVYNIQSHVLFYYSIHKPLSYYTSLLAFLNQHPRWNRTGSFRLLIYLRTSTILHGHPFSLKGSPSYVASFHRFVDWNGKTKTFSCNTHSLHSPRLFFFCVGSLSDACINKKLVEFPTGLQHTL